MIIYIHHIKTNSSKNPKPKEQKTMKTLPKNTTIWKKNSKLSGSPSIGISRTGISFNKALLKMFPNRNVLIAYETHPSNDRHIIKITLIDVPQTQRDWYSETYTLGKGTFIGCKSFVTYFNLPVGRLTAEETDENSATFSIPYDNQEGGE